MPRVVSKPHSVLVLLSSVVIRVFKQCPQEEYVTGLVLCLRTHRSFVNVRKPFSLKTFGRIIYLLTLPNAELESAKCSFPLKQLVLWLNAQCLYPQTFSHIQTGTCTIALQETPSVEAGTQRLEREVCS